MGLVDLCSPSVRPKTLGVIRYTMSALVTPVFPKLSHEENHFGAEIFTCLIREHLVISIDAQRFREFE